MRVLLNWVDTGYGEKPKKKPARPAKARPAKPAPRPPARAAISRPAPAKPMPKPKPPASRLPVTPAAPAKAAKVPAHASGWVKQSFAASLGDGKQVTLDGEVLRPAGVWGVYMLRGAAVLIHLPSSGFVCDGKLDAIKRAAESIPDVGPGWGSAEFAKVARAVLSRKSAKTPPWWREAGEALREACP